jgi:hypothetical protein
VLFSGRSQHFNFDTLFLPNVNRQDLNCSIMTGSERVLDHTTFAELQWRRDPFSPGFFVLSPGFEKRSNLLTEDFVEILEDLNALQYHLDDAR